MRWAILPHHVDVELGSRTTRLGRNQCFRRLYSLDDRFEILLAIRFVFERVSLIMSELR